jgi:hypothetical protein
VKHDEFRPCACQRCDGIKDSYTLDQTALINSLAACLSHRMQLLRHHEVFGEPRSTPSSHILHPLDPKRLSLLQHTTTPSLLALPCSRTPHSVTRLRPA